MAEDPVNQVGRYEILGRIARGGMGVVLRARDGNFGRPIALKVMLDERHDGRLQQRFLREARLAGRLQHPGIPPVYDRGRLPDGRMFFAMKLIEGRSLDALLCDRAAPHDERMRFLGIFLQICQTLAYAHGQGVIHRDLKPSNVMVGQFGEVQVMDWGMAVELYWPSPDDDASSEQHSGSSRATLSYAVETETEPPVTRSLADAAPDPLDEAERQLADESPMFPDDRMTRHGDIVGTPAYMPPEQALGQIQQLRKASDVFSLGAILCEILTAAPPYGAAAKGDLLEQAQRADCDAALKRLDGCRADQEIIAIAKRCLSRDPRNRPADASVLAAEVATYLAAVEQRLEQARIAQAQAETKAVEEQKRRRVSQILVTVVAMAVCGAVAAGGWYWHDRAERAARELHRRQNVESEVSFALDAVDRDLDAILESLSNEANFREFTNSLDDWESLLNSAKAGHGRAKSLADASGVDVSTSTDHRIRRTQERRARYEIEFEVARSLARELDLIRFGATTAIGGNSTSNPDLSSASRQFGMAFALNGWNLNEESVEDLRSCISDSPIRYALIAACDFWALATNSKPWRAQLLQVTRQLDPHPWRDRIRNPKYWGDSRELMELARDASAAQQSPALTEVLAILLVRNGQNPVPLINRALVKNPQDFGLHFLMGVVSPNSVAKIGAYRAALAVRPDADVVHNSLGRVHYQRSKAYVEARRDDLAAAALATALTEFREAIRLRPDSFRAQNNLGLTLIVQGKNEEAAAHLRQATKLQPNYPKAHLNLGLALEYQGRFKEAIDSYRRALELDPEYQLAKDNLRECQMKLSNSEH